MSALAVLPLPKSAETKIEKEAESIAKMIMRKQKKMLNKTKINYVSRI